MKEDEMGGACGTQRKDEKYMSNCRKETSRDLTVDGSITKDQSGYIIFVGNLIRR
jgi:hypothetical protein